MGSRLSRARIGRTPAWHSSVEACEIAIAGSPDWGHRQGCAKALLPQDRLKERSMNADLRVTLGDKVLCNVLNPDRLDE